MSQKDLETLKHQMDELDFDLGRLTRNFDNAINEVHKRGIDTINEAHARETNKIKEYFEKVNQKTHEIKDIEKSLQDMQKIDIQITDTKKEIEHMETVCKTEQGYLFEKNIELVKTEPNDELHEIVLEEPIKLETSMEQEAENSVVRHEAETVIAKSLEDFDLQKINQEELQETEKNLEDIKRESKEKSVKPGVRVKNKPKKKKTIIKVAAFAVSSIIIAGVADAVIVDTINNHYPNKMRTENLREYEETIYEPNTSEVWIRGEINNRLKDTHNWTNIIEQVHEKYENPVVGFYMIYEKLDPECKKYDLKSILAEFNLYYGTNYTCLEDVLNEQGLKNYRELAKYVGYALSNIEDKSEGLRR